MKPIPKQSHIELSSGIITVHTSTNDADQTARQEMPQFGIYYGKGDIIQGRPQDTHWVIVSPLYDPVKVYAYLKELFE